MNIRHCFVVALLASLGLTSVGAAATDLKIATMVPENSQWMKDMRAAGKVIEQRTDGRVKFKFYGGGTQGSEDRVLQKIRIGQLHGGTFAPTDFMKNYSDVNIYGLPFVFASWDEMRYVRGQMDPALEKGFEDVGFVTFGFVGSFSMVLSNERINNHAAMKGKRLWLPKGDDISAAAMKKLELSPVPLPVADVYVSLQTGQLDIAAIPPEVAVALQWHTKVKYFRYAGALRDEFSGHQQETIRSPVERRPGGAARRVARRLCKDQRECRGGIPERPGSLAGDWHPKSRARRGAARGTAGYHEPGEPRDG